MKPELENIDQIGKNAAEHYSPPPPPMAFRKIRKRVLWYSILNLGVMGSIRQYWYAFALTAGVLAVFFSVPSSTNEKSGMAKPAVYFSENRIPAGYRNDVNNGLVPKSGSNRGADVNISAQKYYSDAEANQKANAESTKDISKNASANYSHIQKTNEKGIGNRDLQGNMLNGNNDKSLLSEGPEKQQVNSETRVDLNVNSEIEKQSRVNAGNEVTEDLLTRSDLAYLRLPFSFPIPFAASLPTRNIPSYRQTLEWSVVGNVAMGTGIINGLEQPADVKTVYTPVFQGGGLQIQVERKRWFAGIGLEYSRNSFTYKSREHLYNPQTHPQIIQSDFETVYDSTSFWHYTWAADSVYHLVDSVWETTVDTTIISSYDTLAVVRFDTLRSGKAVQNVTLFMVPLSFGYQIPLGIYEAGFSAGVSAGILSKMSGNLFGESTLSTPFIEASTRFKTNYFVYSWTLSAYLRRSLNDRISIGISPYYRSGINYVKNSESGDINSIKGFGINLQIRYIIF